jgi:transposase
VFVGLHDIAVTQLHANGAFTRLLQPEKPGLEFGRLLLVDGDGLCLFAKRLERGRFVWPRATDGTVHLTQAQLSMLLEGIDWRRPLRTQAPQLAV